MSDRSIFFQRVDALIARDQPFRVVRISFSAGYLGRGNGLNFFHHCYLSDRSKTPRTRYFCGAFYDRFWPNPAGRASITCCPAAKFTDCHGRQHLTRTRHSSVRAHGGFTQTPWKNSSIVTACIRISTRNTARCAAVTMLRNGRSRSPKYAPRRSTGA